MITQNQLYKVYEFHYKELFSVEKDSQTSLDLLNNSIFCSYLLKNKACYEYANIPIDLLNKTLGLSIFDKEIIYLSIAKVDLEDISPPPIGIIAFIIKFSFE